MKRLILLLLLTLTCTSCTALPAEERAFAVALCVEKEADIWRVHGRIPTYQASGGYLTVSGEGATLSAALSDMDASAPMHVNLSQLRLLAVDWRTAQEGLLPMILQTFSDRADVRQGCAVAISDVPAKTLMEALKPVAGARLSKAVDVLLETRMEQGIILPAALADVLRMGRRQSPVLIRATVSDGALTFSGGYPVNGEGRPEAAVTADETALLSLLTGHAKALRVHLSGVTAQVREASANVRLSEDLRSAEVMLSLRATSSSVTPEELEKRLAEEGVLLLSSLSGQGCDVLGLGRKAMTRMHDMNQWHALNWPERYRNIGWTVSVKVNGPA